MRDISTVILTSLFVFLTLISLMAAERVSESTRTPPLEKRETVSDLGLRFTLQR
jgi:hypothetical protein